MSIQKVLGFNYPLWNLDKNYREQINWNALLGNLYIGSQSSDINVIKIDVLTSNGSNKIDQTMHVTVMHDKDFAKYLIDRPRPGILFIEHLQKIN